MEEKYTKLTRFVLLGVVITIAVLGYHFYEHLFQSKSDEAETPTEHEFHLFTQQLYEEELLAHPLQLVKLNLQGKTRASERIDRAREPLLQLNSDLVKETGSTYALMQRLFDNYELDTHAVEHVSDDELQEELDFLHAVLQTKVMKRTMEFLRIRGFVNYDPKSQLQLLQDVWFMQYSRGRGLMGSSGFEHVFLAEIRDQTILGLHNWMYFAEQEAQGFLDYKGYIDRVDLGHDRQLLVLRSTFHDIVKPYNSLLVGTSPELEMSLYTVCFLLSAGKPCPVQLGAGKFELITHKWDWHGKKTIATAFPGVIGN